MPTPVDASQRRLGLIVATSEYRDPTLHRLRAPGTDAQSLAEVLGAPEIGAFEVQILLNLPSHELFRGIAQFCADSRPTDLLLLYISCHGILDDRGRLYYATVNTERRLLAATSVSAQWLNDQLEDCSARRQLLFLDCCHSGAFERGMKGDASLALRNRFGSRGRVVLTASRATEYSFEGERILGAGISSFFTAAMVQGLRTGEADRDQDGCVTVRELYEHVFDRMRANDARQTPAIWEDAAEGDILVAHNPRSSASSSGMLPDYLRMALDSPAPGIQESAITELAAMLDRAEPGFELAARKSLEEVADSEGKKLAHLARIALAAAPRRAAEQVRRELEQRASRLAEELGRQQQEAERQARQQQEDERHARLQQEAEHRARRMEEAQARHRAEMAARRMRKEERRQAARRRLRSLRERAAHVTSLRSVVVLSVSVGLGGVLLLLTFLLRQPPAEETIFGQFPTELRKSCSATTDASATCRLPDGTVVFFRLFDTVAEAHADVKRDRQASDSPPCPESAPPAQTSRVCRYVLGTHTGLAAFYHTVENPKRFYEVRWNPDSHPRLRGSVSTENDTAQSWESLRDTWIQLAGDL